MMRFSDNAIVAAGFDGGVQIYAQSDQQHVAAVKDNLKGN